MGLLSRQRLAAVLLVSLAGLVWLAASAQRLPDLEVRTVPWTTQHGEVWSAFAPGQGFLCRHDGLRRIDVALVRQGAEVAPPELVLREGGPGGEELRRARGELESDGRISWARFEFEPVPSSRGRAFHFQLVPSSGDGVKELSPFVRFRGAAWLGRPWGDRVAAQAQLEGELRSEAPDLRCIAFAMEGLDAAAGPAELLLWATEDEAGGEPLRTARLRPSAPLARGWAFFAFEPIAQSRWRAFRYRLSLPPGAGAVADAEGLSHWMFHGGGRVDTRLLGMSVGAEALGDRDLVFRAWSRTPRLEAVKLALVRAGWRLPLASALWVLAIGVFVTLLPRPGRARCSTSLLRNPHS